MTDPVEFPCANCGAGMTWDPVADALACDFCGFRQEVPRAREEIVERPLEEAGTAARGLGLEVRVSACTTCGARIAWGDRSISDECPYCGSANVLEQESNRNAIRPESLVPLDVGRAGVEESFKAWLDDLWFRPNALRKTRRFRARGVYVPFWTFDCRVHSEWSADSGTYYYESVPTVVLVNGKSRVRTRRVRRIRWRPAWGARDDAYDDMPVNASTGIRGDLVARLGGFDMAALVAYRPEYLAGWSAEEYSVDLEAAWEQGRAEIESRQRARCAADVPGDTHRNLRVQNELDDVRWKHVLLPLWSLQYRYRGKVYTVLVNGQSGRCVGDAPWSPVKIALFALALALVALALGLVTR